MKLLIDNQLPVGLVRHLQTHGLDAVHVSSCGLSTKSDQEIWDYAKTNKCIVITKDEDFVYLSGSDNQGPKVIWVRLGNCRNSVVFAAFDHVLEQLIQALESDARVIEIR